MGGLFAGNLLLRAGWQVDIFERVSGPLSDRGTGIVTHQELLDALDKAGATFDATLGVSIPDRVTYDDRGQVVAELTYPQLLTAWSCLLQVLESAFPAAHYHRGKTLASVQQDNETVTAIFDDGSQARGDLLIGADGIRSVVRAQYLPTANPAYAGYVGWRGLVDESDLGPQAHAALAERFAFGLPPNEQILAYPVAGRNNTTSPGSRRINFVWYRPADENTELRRMQTDAQGQWHSGGIPPHLIRPEILDEVRTAASAKLSPEFAELVHKAPMLFFQPIFDLKSDCMVFGRVALLGDAAFVARPHSGMGVTKAAQDAMELTAALTTEGSLDQALARYQTRRGQFGHAIVDIARDLGASMRSDWPPGHDKEMAERYRNADNVMKETAISPSCLNLPA